MSSDRPPRLVSRLMWAQVLVVAIGAVTPVIAAAVVAPQFFHMHLMQAGVADAHVLGHAEAAFRSALAIGVGLGVIMSLITAGIVSWLLVRRIAAPIEALATSAEAVAAGHFDLTPGPAGFSSELQQLTDSFTSMAERLQRTDTTRSRLLADLAHEVRTPLATLQAYIDGLEDGVLPMDPASWSTMRSQVDRLRRLASDIREVAAAEEHALGIELLPMDLVPCAQSAVHAALPRFTEKQVTLTFDTDERALPIDGDELRLQQVLANLLDNALRHTPHGGTVGVRVSASHGEAVLAVRDSGAGIPCDQLETVFQRFHRVDPARGSADGGGSGLGLTIARAIVVDHRGSILAESDGPGTGASLVVRLPLRSDGT